MRATLDIDDDVLAAAKALAEEKGWTGGEVVSEPVRTGFHKPFVGEFRGGIPLLGIKDPSARVTLEMVDAFRDEASRDSFLTSVC